MSNKITPFLWFDDEPQSIVDYYLSIFKDGQALHVNPAFATFVLHGQEFMALKGGPAVKFSEGVSFFVRCSDQAEVDYFWNALTADGGAPGQCGWLKDKYGLSWQIIPGRLGELLGNPKTAAKTHAAMMQMTRIDIAGLEQAAAS
jgi:predicted 3-demethylubiquinone-9 3-methyltransferase (glyoxalase superfamily)